jgi:hypothetical protein
VSGAVVRRLLRMTHGWDSRRDLSMRERLDSGERSFSFEFFPPKDAAVAGSLLAISAGVDRQIWIVALVALPAIILGGLDSLEGAVVGGLAVGVVESLVGTYQRDYAPWLGDNFAVVSPYVLMLLVLLAKPYGIFGTPEVRRV